MTCHSVFPDRQAMRNLWNRKPSVKKRAGELPYKSISPAFSAVFNRTKRDFFAVKNFLLAARTGISCRKTEKTTAEKRKNPSPGQLFFSIRTDRACIIRLTDCKHIPLCRRHAPRVMRTTFRASGQKESGIPAFAVILRLANPQNTREIPARPSSGAEYAILSPSALTF